MTPVMSALLLDMRRGVGQVYRAPGGFWYQNTRQIPPSYGTSTVEAIVKRGYATYDEWKAGRHGAFPIRATLTDKGRRGGGNT